MHWSDKSIKNNLKLCDCVVLVTNVTKRLKKAAINLKEEIDDFTCLLRQSLSEWNALCLTGGFAKLQFLLVYP
jgi:hypothetical protein